MTAAGLILLALIPLLVVEGFAYTTGGMGSEFWRLPLEQKLDHIGRHLRQWWTMGIAWVGMLAVTLGGMVALAWLLEDALAWIGLGVLVVAVVAWLYGVTIQTATMAVAADRYAGENETPSWLYPLWSAAWMCELSWVVGANLAYVAFGIAILQTDVLAAWAGWVAIGAGGLLVAVVAVFANQAFPQLGLIVPITLGVALLLA